MNIDSLTGTRSYAATAYFRRSESRNNFHLLTKAQVRARRQHTIPVLTTIPGDENFIEVHWRHIWSRDNRRRISS